MPFTCEFQVPQFHIESLRSAHSDTLYLSTALKVYNENGSLHEDHGARTFALGDHQGKQTVTLEGGASFVVDVPPATYPGSDGGSVAWSVILTNTGHTDSGWTAVANKAADAYAGAFAGQAVQGGAGGLAGFLNLAATLGVQEFLNMLTANCDGVVAADGFAYTYKQLAQYCPPGKPWTQTRGYPGTNSPAGCGDNSKYDVTYQIQQVTRPAPPRIGST